MKLDELLVDESEHKALSEHARGEKVPEVIVLNNRIYKESLSIDNVYTITGVQKSTIRYWEKIFCGFLSPERSAGGQRRYNAKEVKKIQFLQKLLKKDRYTLAGARKYIASMDKDEPLFD